VYVWAEEELGSYLNDLPINIEMDASLDKAQFILWITKLCERLLAEDREDKVEKENAMQDLIDSGVYVYGRAKNEREGGRQPNQGGREWEDMEDVSRRIPMCDMTHPYVQRDTTHSYICDITWSYAQRDAFEMTQSYKMHP